MNTITGIQKAWLTETCGYTPSDIIQSATNDGDLERLVARLNFGNTDMSCYGWVEVGTAKIEVTFHPQDEVLEKLADGLREQISMVRAEAQTKVLELEEKLSQLLALPNPDNQPGA